MKSADVFPSKYLRAADLNGTEHVVTIDRVEMETLGDDRKPVVYFKGKEKGLVLNRTNFTAIQDIAHEDDTDDWVGTRIKLVTAKVDFQGKRVPAIRIDEPGKGSARQAPPPPPVEPVETPDDSDIPFVALLPLILPFMGALLA